MYTEDDISDAQDLYGRTKFLGEVRESGCLTIRSSIIGRELKTRVGLVEWFLSQHDRKVRGYTNAIYSGFTTQAFAAILADIIEQRPELSGLYHVSSAPITKYDLLCLLREAYDVPVEIEPYSDVRIDRSLDSTRFRTATGFTPPAWEVMIREMSSDLTPYDQWQQGQIEA
jgi:dTDP-4-dehydrorhamnose reductase